MIAAIVIMSIVLFALFVWAAIARNRAQTRMAERDAVMRAEAARKLRSLDRPEDDA